MPDKPPTPTPLPDERSGGRPPELGMIEELAKTVRRMQANESFDETGVRTIWHRGRQRVEMLSYENKSDTIVKQELSIYGMVVEYRENAPLRTGQIPVNDEASVGGKPMSHLIKMDDRLDSKTLTYASHLLRHIKGRDYYQQHLLKIVNDAIANLGFDESRTAVARLESFDRQAGSLPTMPIDRAAMQKTISIRPRTSHKTLIIALLLGVCGVVGGLGVAYLLGLLK